MLMPRSLVAGDRIVEVEGPLVIVEIESETSEGYYKFGNDEAVPIPLVIVPIVGLVALSMPLVVVAAAVVVEGVVVHIDVKILEVCSAACGA